MLSGNNPSVNDYSISKEKLEKLKHMLIEDYGPQSDASVLEVATRLLHLIEIVGKPIPENL